MKKRHHVLRVVGITALVVVGLVGVFVALSRPPHREIADGLEQMLAEGTGKAQIDDLFTVPSPSGEAEYAALREALSVGEWSVGPLQWMGFASAPKGDVPSVRILVGSSLGYTVVIYANGIARVDSEEALINYPLRKDPLYHVPDGTYDKVAAFLPE